MTRRVWTPAMDAVVRELYPRLGPGGTAAELGTTWFAVRTRARRIGVSRGRRYWTDAERERLRELYPTHTSRECAAVLGRTEKAVAQEVKKLRDRGPLGKSPPGKCPRIPAAAKFVLGFLAAQAAPPEKQKVIERVKIIDRKGGTAKERTRVVEAAAPEPVPIAIDSAGTRQLRRLVGLYLRANHNARVSEMERVLEVPAGQLKAVLNCDWFCEKAGVWGLTPEGNRNVG